MLGSQVEGDQKSLVTGEAWESVDSKKPLGKTSLRKSLAFISYPGGALPGGALSLVSPQTLRANEVAPSRARLAVLSAGVWFGTSTVLGIYTFIPNHPLSVQNLLEE